MFGGMWPEVGGTVPASSTASRNASKVICAALGSRAGFAFGFAAGCPSTQMVFQSLMPHRSRAPGGAPAALRPPVGATQIDRAE